MTDAAATLTAAYATDGAAIDLGRAVHDGALLRDAAIKVPLATSTATGSWPARPARARRRRCRC